MSSVNLQTVPAHIRRAMERGYREILRFNDSIDEVVEMSLKELDRLSQLASRSDFSVRSISKLQGGLAWAGNGCRIFIERTVENVWLNLSSILFPLGSAPTPVQAELDQETKAFVSRCSEKVSTVFAQIIDKLKSMENSYD